MLYPLKFNPILKEMIWGGSRIAEELKLTERKLSKIGENFVLSGLSNDLSVVSEGELKGTTLKELIDTYQHELLGKKVYDAFGNNFPLLIKFIDANDDLSIQVHPNDKLAKEKHNSFGKTEMWYVVDTEKDSTLISGFTKQTNAAEFEQMSRDKQLMSLMKIHSTHSGDVFFIPAGKVHSIGKGNLIAEIQQTSDVTYRIHDFDRVDANGKSRELHHALAMDAMNFTDASSGKVDYSLKETGVVNLATCNYFTTNMYP
ncbi:MAG: class I mannose-6-phosphate isomerase [Salinivirgaceae bacterium]|jgi:mannose-6-phosphate isomerase|nr:class I mannose-6-phosphate isomerase [Salinivirgaceae bacterium]